MTIAKTTFHWRNYTKPTPQNVLGLAAALRRLVAIIAGTTIVLKAPEWVPLSILGIGWALDELKNFASNVIEHEKESATATFDSGEEVTVTKETKDEKEKI